MLLSMKIFLRIAGALIGFLSMVLGLGLLLMEFYSESSFIITPRLLNALGMIMLSFMFCKYAFKGKA